MMRPRKHCFQTFISVCFAWALSFAVAEAKDIREDESRFKQAVLLTEQGQWSQAADLFQSIAQNNPTWPEPKNNLAIALLKMGQIEQARQALEDAVISLPSFKVAQENRKRLYDHLAAVAYERAVGKTEPLELPEFDLLADINAIETRVAVQPEQLLIEAKTESTGDLSQLLTNIVHDWSQAWSRADVEQYLSFYSSRFTPADVQIDYTQWRQQRTVRLRLSRGARISLENIRIYFDTDQSRALAEFSQQYQSATYNDTVIKQLVLGLEDERWQILAERVIQQL